VKIANDGLCTWQPDPYSDPQTADHEPIKAIHVPYGAPNDLIQFVGPDHLVYVVNPCRRCGALIAYVKGSKKDES
jgi:hypothetical protein